MSINGATRYLVWLPLTVVVIAGASAWGALSADQKEMKRRIEAVEQVKEDITTLKVRSARVDERTKAMEKAQEKQGRALIRILNKLDERR